jgi:hypothetical protein
MTDSVSPQFGDDDLFLRDADRDRMALAFGALLGKRQSLMLASDSDVLLEHYGKILVQQLRRHEGVHVEVYFPSSSEALIKRFNDVLAPMSLEDAVSAQGPSLPARILVLHDARSVQSSQLELLARLVNDFPGANVRVVLLVNTTSGLEKDLSAFGKRMSRWTVEALDADAGQVFLSKSTLAGLEHPATALLERLGLIGHHDELGLDGNADLDLAERDPVAEQALLDAVAQHSQPGGNNADDTDQPRRGGSVKWWLLGGATVLLLSVAAVLTLSSKYRDASTQAMQAWLQKIDASVGAADEPEPEPTLDATPSEIDVNQLVAQGADPQAPALVAQPAPDTQAITARIAGALKADTQEQPDVSNSETEPAVPSPLLTLDPVWDDVSTDLQIERVLQSLQPDAAQAVSSRLLAAPVLPETPTQPLEPLGPNASLDVTDEPTLGTTPAAAAAIQVVADTKLPDGNAWVQGLPPGAWVIQYVSVGNEAKARQWIAGRPQLTGLYPVAVLKRSNKERHVVVLKGPFVNRLSAQAFATSADSIKEHWVRSARSVRADMVTP